MRLIRLILMMCVASVVLFGADVTGKWTAEMQGRGGNPMTVTMNLKADGSALTGTVGGPMGDTEITNGKVDGDNISFSVVREFNGNKMTQNYKGKLDGDTIHFTVTREGGQGGPAGGGGRGREFDAKRATS